MASGAPTKDRFEQEYPENSEVRKNCVKDTKTWSKKATDLIAAAATANPPFQPSTENLAKVSPLKKEYISNDVKAELEKAGKKLEFDSAHPDGSMRDKRRWISYAFAYLQHLQLGGSNQGEQMDDDQKKDFSGIKVSTAMSSERMKRHTEQLVTDYVAFALSKGQVTYTDRTGNEKVLKPNLVSQKMVAGITQQMKDEAVSVIDEALKNLTITKLESINKGASIPQFSSASTSVTAKKASMEKQTEEFFGTSGWGAVAQSSKARKKSPRKKKKKRKKKKETSSEEETASEQSDMDVDDEFIDENE